jgi:hypothetical protein
MEVPRLQRLPDKKAAGLGTIPCRCQSSVRIPWKFSDSSASLILKKGRLRNYSLQVPVIRGILRKFPDSSASLI